MIVFNPSNSYFDMEKFLDAQNANEILATLNEIKKDKLIRKSSEEKYQEAASALMAKQLYEMGLKENIEMKELLQKLTRKSENGKRRKNDSKQETIKIASKNIKDPHYEIDITKNRINKNKTSLIMVSAYMKEGYLGRYLIKRNYYFLEDNEEDSKYIYDDLVEKFSRIRARYHSGKIESKEIFVEAKGLLDVTKGDFESQDEDELGTAHKRDMERGHELNGPLYSNKNEQNGPTYSNQDKKMLNIPTRENNEPEISSESPNQNKQQFTIPIFSHKIMRIN